MSEKSLTSINGKSASGDPTEHFENTNAKEALPDSSTGNDAECNATGSAALTLCDSNSVSVNDDKATGSPKKMVQKTKEGLSGETVNGISTGNGIASEISNDPDSIPEMLAGDPKESSAAVKRRFRRSAKTFKKVIRKFPRRAINGDHLPPVKRRIRRERINYGPSKDSITQEEKSTGEGKESQMTNGTADAKDLKDFKNQASAITSKVPKRRKQKRIDVPSALNEWEDVPNMGGSDVISALTGSMEIPQGGSARKRKSKNDDGDKLLSHFQIMQKCLNKTTLYNTMLIDGMYECPICHVRKKQAQYLLLHLKGHSDLTQVFERYQTLGGSIKEMEKTEAMPIFKKRKRAPGKAVEPTEETKTAGSKPDDVGGIARDGDVSGLPLPEAEPVKTKRRKIASNTAAEDEANVSESEPGILTAFDPPLAPVPKKVVRRKRVPFLKIARRWPVTVAAAEQAKRARSHPGVSHMDAIDPEVLLDLKQEIRKKVTPTNPHNCKYCGKIFFSGTGIYAHYSKHARLMSTGGVKGVNSVRPKNGPPRELLNGDSAFDALLAINKDKGAECSREDDFLTLQELETNVNQLLRNLVKDTDTLRELGWPERRVSDLVIDILERCNLQPSYCSQNQMYVSKLQCLRKNMSELFRFCIKEQAMEKFEWNTKLVDIVVREMLAYDKCLNLSAI